MEVFTKRVQAVDRWGDAVKRCDDKMKWATQQKKKNKIKLRKKKVERGTGEEGKTGDYQEYT